MADVGQILFGGLGASTNPNDYSVNNPLGGQINGLMQQPQAQLDPTQQAQFRAMQIAQAQQLQRIASGQQQGAGELAAQRQVQNALAAQQAQARMARGGNSALAMRQAADNSAAVGLSGAGQAQRSALQDQQAAQAALTGALGQGRGQDINFAGQNAQLYGQRYGQNLDALTSLNGQNLQARNSAMQSTLGQQGIAGGLLNTAGTVLGSIFSDENLKTDIQDAGDDIDTMLSNLHAKTYRYKDPKHGEGERAGVMAQDLAKSKAGAAIVVPTPDGLALDPNKAISALLAATARLHERTSKLEGKRA